MRKNGPAFVIDSTVALSWCFQDQATAGTANLLERLGDETALVPALWYLELTNVLALAERKRCIDRAQVAEFVALIESLDLETDDQGPGRALSQLLPLCRAHQLTSYDAVYLELALRTGLPLATLDQPLRAAAKQLGVKLPGA